MAESTRPKPANGGLPAAGRILMTAGGEVGSVDTPKPAMVVDAREIGEDDPRGYQQGEYRADLVVFTANGSGATPYTDVLVLGNVDDARKHFEDNALAKRDPADVSPAFRGLVAFWPSR